MKNKISVVLKNVLSNFQYIHSLFLKYFLFVSYFIIHFPNIITQTIKETIANIPASHYIYIYIFNTSFLLQIFASSRFHFRLGKY